MKYSVNRKPRTIEYRFTEQRDKLNGLQDFPPTPEAESPDWWHIWRPEGGDDPESGGLRRRKTAPWEQSGALKFMPQAVYDAALAACGVDGSLKTREQRDQLKLHHAVLASLLFKQAPSLHSNYCLIW